MSRTADGNRRPDLDLGHARPGWRFGIRTTEGPPFDLDARWWPPAAVNGAWGILAGGEALALLSRVDGAWGLSDGLLDACECAGGGGASG
jgi:hypothetical protein